MVIKASSLKQSHKESVADGVDFPVWRQVRKAFTVKAEEMTD
jgi:hypothetical protein